MREYNAESMCWPQEYVATSVCDAMLRCNASSNLGPSNWPQREIKAGSSVGLREQ